MSSIIKFRKEFEDLILGGNLKEVLKTLVPNSNEKIYLEFCEEYKKCFISKKISPKINEIIENAEENNISKNLIKILKTRKDLLEYDLPKTSQKRKNEIIEDLYSNYCNEEFNYETPYFVREKKSGEEVKNEKKNDNPLFLTEKMITEAIKKKIKEKSKYKEYEIKKTPENKRHNLFLEYLDKDADLCHDIITDNIYIPFYLMNKDEFSKVVKFFNSSEKNIDIFNYTSITIEQINTLLNQVDNPKFYEKSKLIDILFNKKYNKLIDKARKKNDLKEIKKILLEIYDIYKKYSPKNVSGILLYILEINKEDNIYDKKPLLEYLKNPIVDDDFIEQESIYINKIKNKNMCYLKSLSDISKDYSIKEHKFIEELLIEFLFLNKAHIEDFMYIFKDKYLNRLGCIAKLLRGEEVKSEIYSKYLSKSEYDEIVKRTVIGILRQNKKEFKIDEEVKIDFYFKNIKSINLSIYEINTENYYLSKKAPLNSQINIEGIISSQTMDIKIEGGENPLKCIKKTIEIDQIPKGKPGVFLVEILGNGMSSRIIIKKGRLNLITRNTPEGILCQIINEKNEVLKDDKTYLWYNDIKFTCEPKEGLILLPYKVLNNSNNKCILVHDSFAEFTEIKRKTENYILKGYFNFLNESIIPGNMLKVNFKPLLFSNGREASLEYIKKGTISVEMLKLENEESLPVSTVFENITFKDDNKDYEFEVLIPQMMTEMNFSFNCEVFNSNTGEKKSLSYTQNSNFYTSNNIISMPFFHKIGKNYIYEIIGRNGENITDKAGTNADLRIITNDFLDEISISLQYDQKGRLNLGELKNVKSIKIENKMYNLDEFVKYCYPSRIDIIPGESFTLPIYSYNKISLDNNDFFQLYEFHSKNEIFFKNDISSLKDIKKEIKLKELNINGDNRHYYEFTLGQTLPKGKYCLNFGQNNDLNTIIIKVRDGKHWMNIENYIINDKGYIENSQVKTPIYMKNLNIDKDKGEIIFECSPTRRNIKYTHANIYLSQYYNPDFNAYFNSCWNMYNEGVENIISCKFSIWKNIYLSSRVLNEEIEYVLQRRNLQNQLGNSLPMPSLLLKRVYKKDCVNEEEKLEEGEVYKGEESAYNKERKKAKKRLSIENEKGVNTDFYNFLKNSGYALNNIEPININSKDEFAKFKIKFNEKEKDILKKYSYIHIILIDNKSISSDLHCLCSDNDKFKIEKRNISNEKALDSNKNLTEIKKTELIKKGEEFTINETSNYKLVDSIQKLSKFYLLTLKQKNSYWDKFKFILNLNEDKFNEEEFIEKYNEVCGHEINLFLYFKYPNLFNKYIKGILKYKFEKTFIDYFLLDDYETLIQYLSPLKIKLLRTDELCLLMLKIIDKKPEDAKKIRDIIKSRVKKSDEAENKLLTNFNIMMNMRVEEDDNLKNIISPEKDKTYKAKEKKIILEEAFDEEADEDIDIDEEDYEDDAVIRPKAKYRLEDEEECPVEIMKECMIEECDYKKDMIQKDDLIYLKSKAYKSAVKNAKKDIGDEFEKPGKVKEYKERHYYIKEHKNSNVENPLWFDLSEHILSTKSYENFLSKYVLYNDIDFNEYLLILSIIGLPIESIKHEYKRIQNSRLISIISGSNLILFTKELTETKLDIDNKLLISQNIIDTLHNDINVNINNCTTGIKYIHQSIITNISNKSIMFQLFIQIPQGAICLEKSYYTNSIKFNLGPYETKNHKIYFYFPSIGKFPQYHPLACKNSNIISIGNSLLYEVKKEYTPSKKSEIIENNKYAKDMRIDGKLVNILSDDTIDSKKKLNNIINYFTNDIFDDEDVDDVLYLLKDNKDFYLKFISALRDSGFYNDKVWAFAFHHKDEEGIKEYLGRKEELKADLGYDFKSSLFSYSDLDDAKIHPHLEYFPLYNARKHPFGIKGNNNETSIANREFNETYHKFIVDLLSLKTLTIKEELQLIYYLILQDRMEEAFNVLKKVKKEEIENNKSKSYKIQYDYINAYLDFCFGYPDFTIAKSLCNKYKDFPLMHWREKFEEIEDQLFEYEKKEKIIPIGKLPGDEKKSLTKELREKEPKISFNTDGKEGKITLIHSNISKVDIKFYFIDLETIFTRDPTISELVNQDNIKKSNEEMMENFGFVQPNYSETIKIPNEKNNKNDNITVYQIPEKYRNKNLFLEINTDSIKLFDICLSSNLIITITESIGELKVIDNNLQSIIKAYVKVYVELNGNKIEFYKDGYTDLNGKFNYLALNTDQLKNAKKFFIFVSEEKHGSTIRECYPPKNIYEISSDDVLGNIQRYKQNQRNQWRAINKFV